MRAKIQIINFTLNGITPFRLGVVERTLAQFGPYYFDRCMVTRKNLHTHACGKIGVFGKIRSLTTLDINKYLKQII